jgi:hypothetical protein
LYLPIVDWRFDEIYRNNSIYSPGVYWNYGWVESWGWALIGDTRSLDHPFFLNWALKLLSHVRNVES